MLAGIVHPCLALDQDEAAALAKALANVQRHYPNVRLLSDKHQALFGLGVVGTRIYGKRMMIIAGVDMKPNRPAKDKPKPIEPGGNVFAHPANKESAPDPMAALGLPAINPEPPLEPWAFPPDMG